MSRTYEQILEQCADDIRQGHAHSAARRLAQPGLRRVPDHLRLEFAKLCNRAGLVTKGLSFLTPRMFSRAKRPTPAETAEYANLLRRNGLTSEAYKLFLEVDPVQYPRVLLYLAHRHFSRWEYDLAIPFIRQYLDADLASDAWLVGRVNLAAALVENQDWPEARAILEDTMSRALETSYTRIYCNCLELRAQTFILGSPRDLSAARNDLSEAERLLRGEGTFDELFVEKWQSILSLVENGADDKLMEFRAQALSRGHWESVRECDFHLLKAGFDSARFNHLLFGTPFPGYRSKIRDAFPFAEPAEVFRYGVANSPALDLRSGTFEGIHEALNPGKKNHQILHALLGDLYRPCTIGTLFSEMFPDERFDIFSSPNRVHQAVRRARCWILDAGLPMRIVSQKQCFALELSGPFAFVLSLEKDRVNTANSLWARLSDAYSPGESFSTSEGVARLNISSASFHRLKNWALNEGLLRRFGSGPYTRYAILPVNQRSCA